VRCSRPARAGLRDPSLHDALPICQEPLLRYLDPERARGLQHAWLVTHAVERGFIGERNAHVAEPFAVRQDREYGGLADGEQHARSEEHTSELQSREKLVCRLLLDK